MSAGLSAMIYRQQTQGGDLCHSCYIQLRTRIEASANAQCVYVVSLAAVFDRKTSAAQDRGGRWQRAAGRTSGACAWPEAHTSHGAACSYKKQCHAHVHSAHQVSLAFSQQAAAPVDRVTHASFGKSGLQTSMLQAGSILSQMKVCVSITYARSAHPVAYRLEKSSTRSVLATCASAVRQSHGVHRTGSCWALRQPPAVGFLRTSTGSASGPSSWTWSWSPSMQCGASTTKICTPPSSAAAWLILRPRGASWRSG